MLRNSFGAISHQLQQAVQQGYGVTEAANADEAMAVLRTGTRIDLVLTDIQLHPRRHWFGSAFFPKPCAMDHLVKCVRQLLDRDDEPLDRNNVAPAA